MTHDLSNVDIVLDLVYVSRVKLDYLILSLNGNFTKKPEHFKEIMWNLFLFYRVLYYIKSKRQDPEEGGGKSGEGFPSPTLAMAI